MFVSIGLVIFFFFFQNKKTSIKINILNSKDCTHTHTHTIFYFIPKQNKNCYCLVTFKNWKEWCLKKNAINWKHISYIFVRDILNNWNNNKQLDFGGQYINWKEN